MQVTDVGAKEEGKVWHRKPTPNSNGIIVRVIRSASAYQSKTVRFLHVAFDTTGESFLAGDHHGNIYVFDISRNRFRLVQKTGQACTALAFNLRRTTEYLVALADYSIKCFDKDTKQLVSWMRGHEGAVSHLSVHSSGRYAISTSADAAQLWDLDTFQRKRKLNVRQSVAMQRVFFLPLSNTILSCFGDDSIFAWESDTLACKYQLPVPDQGPRLHYKAFSVTSDGKTLAAGGRSNLVHLWCLESRQLLRVVQMPVKVRTVRQLEFLRDSLDGGASQTLGVLSQDGIMRFINTQSCKLLFAIGSQEKAISSVALSPSGRNAVAVMDDGSLNIYSVQGLTRDLNKPPQPLVKAMIGGDSEEHSALWVKVKDEKVQGPAKTSGRRVQTRGRRPPAVSMAEDKENDLPDGLNKKRLVALLKAFGEYPAKYRMFVWRSLLRLPENHAAFSSLTDKGLHPAYASLQERYPIKSHKLQRGLHRVLSALAHWSAIFGETDYLPLVAFPFVKLFQNNPLVCFEVVATVIVNWCQHWFEYFPNPPLNVLSMAENVLAHHDKELLQHFIDCGVTSQLYVWPLLETLFSEVLTRDEWLRLFDNVFSNHPSFLLMAAVAYVTSCRAPLLLCSRKEDFEFFFHHRNNLDLVSMLKEAYRLMDSTPAELHPRGLLADAEPLTRGQYPVFNKYPSCVVEYQSQERQRIREQELEYLRERQALQKLRVEAVRRKASEEAWYTQQELLQQAEEQRRRILEEEEARLTLQRTKLAAMKRELKVKELQLLDAARARFLKHAHDQRTSQLHRLDHDIQRKMDLRDQETAAAVQDLEVRQMELEAQRKLLEQHLAREQERVSQEVRVEVDTRTRRAELEAAAQQQRLLRLDDDTELGPPTRRVLEESLAEVAQLGADAAWQGQVTQRLRRAEEEQGSRYERLAGLHREARAREEELLHTLMEKEGRKWEEVVCLQGQPQQNRLTGCGAAARRTQQLSQDRPETQQHLDDLRRSQQHTLDGQSEREAMSPCPTRGLPPRPATAAAAFTSAPGPSPAQEDGSPVCLNNQSASDVSTSFSLDRGREQLDTREREMMRDILELRLKLAARAKRTLSCASLSSISQ